MIVRSRAPLRIGLAGGGTDVSPYSDDFGGCILNASINMYAHTTIEKLESSSLCTFMAKDIEINDKIDISKDFGREGPLMLHRAVYKRIMEQFNNFIFVPVRVVTYSDAPPGSGLGSSSTMVVSMIEAYKRLLSLPLGEYDVAKLAYQIERIDCGLSGGKQDQYAATFGGFNFMEFNSDDRVIVNPLRVRRHIVNELEASMILYYTGQSRDSDKIINDQVAAIKDPDTNALTAMHKVKSSAIRTKEMLLKGDILGVANELKYAWQAKKLTSKSISNVLIDNLETVIIDAGAISLKISGAGGGGFMMIFVHPESKLDVIKALAGFDGEVHRFQFTEEGSMTWTI